MGPGRELTRDPAKECQVVLSTQQRPETLLVMIPIRVIMPVQQPRFRSRNSKKLD